MAEERHPQCVLVATDLKAAAGLAEWLTEKGFPAEVHTPSAIPSAGDSLGISEGAAPQIEVRVVKEEHAAPAKVAVEEMRAEVAEVRARLEKRAARTGTVAAMCEECGKESQWPAAMMGTTETCPHCGQYMDIPDPEDDWGDMDFGAEDGDNG